MSAAEPAMRSARPEQYQVPDEPGLDERKRGSRRTSIQPEVKTVMRQMVETCSDQESQQPRGSLLSIAKDASLSSWRDRRYIDDRSIVRDRAAERARKEGKERKGTGAWVRRKATIYSTRHHTPSPEIRQTLCDR